MKPFTQHQRDIRRHLFELLVALLLVALLLLIGKLAIGQSPQYEKVKSIVNNYVSDKHNDALIVGIINGDERHIYVYGETEKGNDTVPDPNSIFQIGTVTQVFTTSLLAEMQQEGKIEFTDPVQMYFPEGVKIPTYEKVICKQREGSNSPMSPNPTGYYCFVDPKFHPKQITLCDLASNTSGLPELPSNVHAGKNAENPFANYTDNDFYSFLNKYNSNCVTGFTYQQSMTGVALLGKALANKMNINYEELLKENILGPLSLCNTTITLDEQQQKLFLKGHKSNGDFTSHWNYNALAPAGGLRSDANDLLSFLNANMSGLDQFLQGALRITHDPRLSITGDKNLVGSQTGMGWIITPVNTGNTVYQMIWCSSAQGGFASYLGMVETSKTGVVVLSNSANAVDDLGKKILELLNQQMNIPTIGTTPTD